MNRDKAIGISIFVISIVILIVYFWLIFLSPPAWQMLTLQITAFIAVGAILIILAWIGYTLATTPSPEIPTELAEELEKKESETKQ